MTKRINVSVSDELFEKIEKWKDSFNYSKLFQNTVSVAIQDKEDFQNRLKEDPETLEQVIARLKKEKKKVEKSYFSEGKEKGLSWAMAASYSDLMHAIEWNTKQKGMAGWKKSLILGSIPIAMVGLGVTAPATAPLAAGLIGAAEGFSEGMKGLRGKINPLPIDDEVLGDYFSGILE